MQSSAQRNAGQASGKAALYASVGEELFWHDADIAAAMLTPRGSIWLPAQIQYAVPSPSGRYLYTVSGKNDGTGDHFLNAFRIDQATGALRPQGQPALLPHRPIHVALDQSASHALVAFNQTGTVAVYRLKENGGIGDRIAQPDRPDAGVYPHQVRVSPAGETVITVALGSDPRGGRPEGIGSLNVFRYRDGILTKGDKIHFGPGLGPRHIDFHPSKPWAYVSFERGNKLHAYSLQNGTLGSEPLFVKETLADPGKATQHRQMAGAIHVHPSGRFVYLSNRHDVTVKDESGEKVYAGGGENNIAVYAIDQDTGEPALIQHADTRGIWARSFTLDPSGRMLVVGNMSELPVREGGTLGSIPRSLAVFRVRSDGTLEYARKYDVRIAKELFWTGFAGLGDQGRDVAFTDRKQ
jgi:6-phosphogluconolactonase (cycloisomerase 2 family)